MFTDFLRFLGVPHLKIFTKAIIVTNFMCLKYMVVSVVFHTRLVRVSWIDNYYFLANKAFIFVY